MNLAAARGKGATVRLKGNVFVVTFRHPLLKKVVRKSLRTDQKRIADKYKEQLDSLVKHPEHWHDLPDGTFDVVRDIWGQETAEISINTDSKVSVKVPLHNPLQGFDIKRLEDKNFWKDTDDQGKTNWIATLMIQASSLANEVARLRGVEARQILALEDAKDFRVKSEARIADLIRERNYWKARRLSKLECGTLGDESKKYVQFFEQKKNNRFYITDIRNVIERFAEELGKDRSLADIDEQEVAQWVALLRNRKDASPITEKRRRFIRIAVLAFMDQATKHTFNRKAVSAIGSHRIRREQTEISWLERADAEALVTAMYSSCGEYWGDLTRVHLDQGWRPIELTMLQKRFVTDRTITLDGIEGEAPKTGKRTVQIPPISRLAIERRMLGDGPLLFSRLVERRAVRSREGSVSQFMWDPTVFYRRYSENLKTAAKAAGLKYSTDARILRRTFGSLQLRGGKKEHEVAALMGDRVETIRRHYARILAEEIGVELGPM